MNVKQLIEELKNQPQELEVVFEGWSIDIVERLVNPMSHQEWIGLSTYSDVEETAHSNQSCLN